MQATMQHQSIHLVFMVYVVTTNCCMFPERFQGATWYTNIRRGTRTSIYFRQELMEFQREDTELNYISDEWQCKCEQMVDVNKYIVSNENGTFFCLAFIPRSASVMQIKQSHLSSNYLSSLCEDKYLAVSNWLMVSLAKSHKEFTVCPFSGGYNMKIKDKDNMDHPCNFMDLPMRFESECHAGEGVTFDLRARNCIGDLPMQQRQRALCVTSWREDGDVVIVLRGSDTDIMWCLRIPARKSYDGRTIMELFIDLACEQSPGVTYFTLELELVSQNSLCIDEHKSCDRLPCTNIFESQCLKSCGKCNPNVYPASCDFPKKLRGLWTTSDSLGTASIQVSETQLFYDRLGTFNCITFPDSPPLRKTKQYTAVSFFNNGCRPRYTCLSFKRMSSDDVMGMAVSQSKVWPLQNGHENVWSEICNTDNFHGDPSPIHDYFRTYNDVYKPIISITSPVVGQLCPINTTYIFNATFSAGGTCAGSLYQHCQQPSLLRFQFEKCQFINDSFQDFVCIDKIESKYWENIILIQNKLNPRDNRCLVMSSIEPSRFIVLPSGECDQYTWTYVNVGIRKAFIDLTITPENHWCKTITTTSTTVSVLHSETTFHEEFKPLQDAFKSDTNSETGGYSPLQKETHKHRHHNKEHYITSTSPYIIDKNSETKLTDSQINQASHKVCLELLIVISVVLLELTVVFSLC